MKYMTEAMSLDEIQLYSEFCNWAVKQEFLSEEMMSESLKNVILFVKDMAVQIGRKLKDVINILLEKTVFALFAKLGWNWNKVMELVKAGYGIVRKITNFLPDLMASLVTKGLDKVLSSKNKEDLKKVRDAIAEFIEKHNIVKLLAGVGLAAFIIYVWLNMSYIGDPLFDFDMSDIVMALAGRLNPAIYLTSNDGIKMLILLATGLAGISFAWFSTPVNLAITMISTLAKLFKKPLTKDYPASISQDLASAVT
jgi:hypothetical protein